MSFVLDASVTLSWCFRAEEEDDDSLRVLRTLRASEAIVPPIWGLEVVNGLLVAERRGRADAPELERVIRMLLDLPIAVDPGSRSDPFLAVRRLARAHRLTSYDASYLELALRHGLPLATGDAVLTAAAEKEGVERFTPGSG